jgi:Flp pilus assembly protein TadG
MMTLFNNTSIQVDPLQNLKGDDGVTRIEIAFLLPLLMLLYFGITMWGGTLVLLENVSVAARQPVGQLSVGTADGVKVSANAAAEVSRRPLSYTVTPPEVRGSGANDARAGLENPGPFATLLSKIVDQYDPQFKGTAFKD